jgi:hypothetical protein
VILLVTGSFFAAQLLATGCGVAQYGVRFPLPAPASSPDWQGWVPHRISFFDQLMKA